MEREQWNVGEPDGPAGPFFSVVSSTGRVIAMQVPSRKIAEQIAALPDLLDACQAALPVILDKAARGECMHDGPRGTWQALKKLLVAAIRKATGSEAANA